MTVQLSDSTMRFASICRAVIYFVIFRYIYNITFQDCMKIFVVLFAAQSFLNYALLCIVFTTLHAYRIARSADCCTVKKQHLLLYILVSVVDVEANYLVVKAYQYTTVTSVQVLVILTVFGESN